MTPMRDDVILLAGVKDPVNRPLTPFSKQAMAFLDTLSLRIRAASRQFAPEVVSFGFWCRSAHLLQLKERHSTAGIRIGRGLLFHVAPANVPTMFAYSYAIGLLAGNANIVRVSGRSGDSAFRLCELIRKVLEESRFSEIRKRTSIISYEKSTEITGEYMSKCDGRVIWGGDGTVREMRAFPIPPHAVEAVFPDRWSAAILGQRALTEMDSEAFSACVHDFYNDTYVMDQRGCSSPQMVLWLCDGGNPAVRERFWQCLAAEAEASYKMDGHRAAEKLETACLAAMRDENVVRFGCYGGNMLYMLSLGDLPEKLTEYRGGFGLFYEAEISSVTDFSERANPRVQTIVCAGVDKNILSESLAAAGARGVDRIVDPGRALEMDTVWDGKDLIALFSREISSN